MLSRHPERCRFPHGHTRTIEIVVRGTHLDDNGMLADFTALKLAASDIVERFDHSMAVNSADLLLPALRDLYPEGLVVFEGQDPTTEAIAKLIFDEVAAALAQGCERISESGVPYRIPQGQVDLERVRVWETPTSWAEYGV